MKKKRICRSNNNRHSRQWLQCRRTTQPVPSKARPAWLLRFAMFAFALVGSAASAEDSSQPAATPDSSSSVPIPGFELSLGVADGSVNEKGNIPGSVEGASSVSGAGYYLSFDYLKDKSPLFAQLCYSSLSIKSNNSSGTNYTAGNSTSYQNLNIAAAYNLDGFLFGVGVRETLNKNEGVNETDTSPYGMLGFSLSSPTSRAFVVFSAGSDTRTINPNPLSNYKASGPYLGLEAEYTYYFGSNFGASLDLLYFQNNITESGSVGANNYSGIKDNLSFFQASLGVSYQF